MSFLQMAPCSKLGFTNQPALAYLNKFCCIQTGIEIQNCYLPHTRNLVTNTDVEKNLRKEALMDNLGLRASSGWASFKNGNPALKSEQFPYFQAL